MRKLFLAYALDDHTKTQIKEAFNGVILPHNAPCSPILTTGYRLQLLFLDTIAAEQESLVIERLGELFGEAAPHAAFVLDTWRVFQGRGNPAIGYLALTGSTDRRTNLPLVRMAIRAKLHAFLPEEEANAWLPLITVGSTPWSPDLRDLRVTLLDVVHFQPTSLQLCARKRDGFDILASFPCA